MKEQAVDKYQERHQQLVDKIAERDGLKKAFHEDSANYEEFQQEINALREQLRHLEWAIPRMVDLDQRIQSAELRADWAKDSSQSAADTWNSTAWVLGIPGALGLLVCLWWVPTPWLPVLAVAALLGAAGAMVGGTRARQAAWETREDAKRTLRDLQMERDALEPTTGSAPAQREPQEYRPMLPGRQ